MPAELRAMVLGRAFLFICVCLCVCVCVCVRARFAFLGVSVCLECTRGAFRMCRCGRCFVCPRVHARWGGAALPRETCAVRHIHSAILRFYDSVPL